VGFSTHKSPRTPLADHDIEVDYLWVIFAKLPQSFVLLFIEESSPHQ
jgi:hypothetical protein